MAEKKENAGELARKKELERRAAQKEAAIEAGVESAGSTSWKEMARGAAAALTDSFRALLELPARLGRTWQILGLVSAIAGTANSSGDRSGITYNL